MKNLISNIVIGALILGVPIGIFMGLDYLFRIVFRNELAFMTFIGIVFGLGMLYWLGASVKSDIAKILPDKKNR